MLLMKKVILEEDLESSGNPSKALEWLCGRKKAGDRGETLEQDQQVGERNPGKV